MRLIQASVFVCFMTVGWACISAQTSVRPGASTATQSVPHVKRKLVRNEAEVKRLERDVRQQESDSKQAGERLQQQDKTIADLHKQLQELQASQSGGPH